MASPGSAYIFLDILLWFYFRMLCQVSFVIMYSTGLDTVTSPLLSAAFLFVVLMLDARRAHGHRAHLPSAVLPIPTHQGPFGETDAHPMGPQDTRVNGERTPIFL